MKNRIGCIAKCTECEWSDEWYKTARDAARSHAKETGHKVVGEETVSFEYGTAKPAEASGDNNGKNW